MQASNYMLFVRGKRIFVTGASGFIGQHLIKELVTSGAHIYGLNRKSIGKVDGVHEFIGDLCDKEFVKNIIYECDPNIIFHLAANKDRSSAVKAFFGAVETNLIGSLNLFSTALGLSDLNSIVVVGTAEEYGNNQTPYLEGSREHPVSAYSYSKLCITHLAEIFHEIHDLPISIARPTLAYGPGQDGDMFLPSLIRAVINDMSFPMTLGEQTRDFIYVRDLVEALILMASNSQIVGETINIGSGEAVMIKELAQKVETLAGKTDLIQFGARDYRLGEVMNYSADIQKAKRLLSWTPTTSLDEGLIKTISFYESGS